MNTTADKLTGLLSSKADIKAAIESKGVEVGDAALSLYADKIRGIQGGGDGEIETLLKDNGYDELIDVIMSPLERSLLLNESGTATWNDYFSDAANYQQGWIVNPVNVIRAGSGTVKKDHLLYVGENIDYSAFSSMSTHYQYCHNLLVFKPRDFNVCTSFADAFMRTSIKEITINAPICTTFNNMLQHNYALEEITINCSAENKINFNYFCDGCRNLKKITINDGGNVVPYHSTGQFHNFAHDCQSLKEINAIFDLSNITAYYNIFTTINLETVWFKNLSASGLMLTSCPLVKKECLVYLLENAADITGQGGKTIYLGSANLAKLSDEEKAIATNKGWTLS